MDGNGTPGTAPDSEDVRRLPCGVLVLGDVRVDLRNLRVVGRGEAGRLTPKSVAVLRELAAVAPQLVTRSELLDRAWPNSFPTPDALSQCIRELRRALGDDARAPRIIETVHGVGYRLKIQFEELSALPPAPASTEAVAAPGPAPQPLRATRSGLTLLLASACALVLALTAWLAPGTAGEAQAPEVSLVTSDPGAEEFPALSPDGALLAYTARESVQEYRELAVRSAAGGRPMLLTSTPDVDELLPSWSPDGKWIAFVRLHGEHCTIERIPATGGVARRLAECDRTTAGTLAWMPSGEALVASLPSAGAAGEPRLHRLPADGGEPLPLSRGAAGTGWERDPAVSPDGRWIAFRRGVPPDSDLYIMPSSGGEARRLTTHGRIGEGLAWSGDGRHLVVSHMFGGDPCLQHVDIETGASVPLGILSALRPHVTGGQLTFQRQRQHVQMVSLPLQPAADELPQPVAASTGSVRLFAVAPAHGRIAYLSDRGGSEQLWVETAAGDAEVYPHPPQLRITSFDWADDGASLLVVWSGTDVEDALVRLDLGRGRYQPLGLQRPLLRDVVHGRDADEVYAIDRHAGRALVTRFARGRDGAWTAARSDTHAVELVRVPGRPGVYAFTPATPDRIVHLDASLASTVVPVRPRLHGWSGGSDGRIWYLAAVRTDASELRSLDVATGQDRLVRELPYVSPGRRTGVGVLDGRVVLGLLAEDATDIGTATLR